MNSSSPFWEQISIYVDPKYSYDAVVRFTFMKCNIEGNHKMIGSVESTMNDLFGHLNQTNQFKLRKVVKTKSKEVKISGTVNVNCLSNHMSEF